MTVGVPWSEHVLVASEPLRAFGTGILSNVEAVTGLLMSIATTDNPWLRVALRCPQEPGEAVIFRWTSDAPQEITGMYPGNAWRRRYGFDELEPMDRAEIEELGWQKPKAKTGSYWWLRSVATDQESVEDLVHDAIVLVEDACWSSDYDGFLLELWDTYDLMHRRGDDQFALYDAGQAYGFHIAELIFGI